MLVSPAQTPRSSDTAEHAQHRLRGLDALLPAAFGAIDAHLAAFPARGRRAPLPHAMAPFDVKVVPAVTLTRFAQHLAQGMQHGALAPLMGLVLALRVCATHEVALTPRVAHRLLLAATAVAVQAHCDAYYSVRYMARIGGVPEAADLGRLQRHVFFGLLSGSALVHARDVVGEHGVVKQLAGLAGSGLPAGALGRAAAALLTDNGVVAPVEQFLSLAMPIVVELHEEREASGRDGTLESDCRELDHALESDGDNDACGLVRVRTPRPPVETEARTEALRRFSAWMPEAACASQSLCHFTESPPSVMLTTAAAASVTSVDAAASIVSRIGDADDGNARQRLRARLSDASSYAAEHQYR